MKQIQKRMFVQILLGFLLGRVILFDRNPVGAAYFVAVFSQGGAVFPVATAICLGMFSSLKLVETIRYGVAMLAVVLAAGLFRYRKLSMKLGQCAVVMSVTLVLLSAVQYYLLPFQGQDILFAVLDAVLVLAFSRILYEGQRFLVGAKKGQQMETEQAVSMIVMGALAILGLPDIMVADVSVVELASYLLLLTLGYWYGTRTRVGKGEQIQELMSYKLKDFSRSFRQLSRVLASQSRERTGPSRHDLRVLMQEMSEQVCEKCENRGCCMGQVAIGRPENIGMLAMAQEQGSLVLEQMPAEFSRECIHPDWFLMETNQSLRMARTIMSFQNKLAQNRQVIAGQMEQVGTLMEELAEDIKKVTRIPGQMERTIVRELSNMQVRVENLATYEDKSGHWEVHMVAATTKGRLATTKKVAGVLTDVLGKPFMTSPESRNIVPRQAAEVIFVEDTPLYALTGVARVAKEGEEVCGDTFSCLALPNGELLLALSDGMGSGEEAREESQTVIELLEQMTEAGFSKISAMKLINSLYMPEEEEAHYATADVVVLDLYQGDCQFIKNGAAATWLRRENTLERIEGQALPVGVVQDAQPYLEKTKLSSGDYVIMMTDGVSDVFAEEELEELFLKKKKILNPQELAEYILESAITQCGGHVRDDMSVIAAGVWER